MSSSIQHYLLCSVLLVLLGCQSLRNNATSSTTTTKSFTEWLGEFRQAVANLDTNQYGGVVFGNTDNSGRFDEVDLLTGIPLKENGDGCIRILFEGKVPNSVEIACPGPYSGLNFTYFRYSEEAVMFPLEGRYSDTISPFDGKLMYDGFDSYSFLLPFKKQGKALLFRCVPKFGSNNFQNSRLDQITSIYLTDEFLQPQVIVRFEMGQEYFVGKFHSEDSLPYVSYSRRNELGRPILDLRTMGPEALITRMIALLDEPLEEFARGYLREDLHPAQWPRRYDPRMEYKPGFVSARKEYGTIWLETFHRILARSFDTEFPFKVPGEIKLPEER